MIFKSSCVSKEKCDKDNDVVTGPREDFTQKALADATECPDSSNHVCCYYEDVKDDLSEYFDTVEPCSDHKLDGYRYVLTLTLTIVRMRNTFQLFF